MVNVAKSTSLVVAQRDENENVTGFVDEDGKPLDFSAAGGGSGGTGGATTVISVTAPLTKTGSNTAPTLAIPAATTAAPGHMLAAHVQAINDNTTAIAGKASAAPAPAAITASRTLTAADNGGTLYSNTATAYTLTVPTGLPAGFGVAIVQKSTGAVTVVAGASATVVSKDGFTKTGGANSVIALTHSGVANDYILSGQGAA